MCIQHGQVKSYTLQLITMYLIIIQYLYKSISDWLRYNERLTNEVMWGCHDMSCVTIDDVGIDTKKARSSLSRVGW